jgi:hypothetical protein
VTDGAASLAIEKPGIDPCSPRIASRRASCCYLGLTDHSANGLLRPRQIWLVSSEQVLPSETGPSISCRNGQQMSESDGADATRAFVCAFSSRGEGLLAPVGTQAIQGELNRHNLAIRASEILPRLAELGDLQRLSGGFWLPAPLRVIDCGDVQLGICGLPTRRLASQFQVEAIPLGFTRELIGPIAASVARRESLFEWLGQPSDTNAWAEHYAASAKWVQPFGIEDIQIYRSWRSRFRDRWISPENLFVNQNCVLLARLISKESRAHYYLAKVRRGVIQQIHELPERCDVARIMCAFRNRDGDPTVARFSTSQFSQMTAVQLEILPAEETRFIRAIGRLGNPQDRFISLAHIPRRLARSTRLILESLGVVTQGMN